ncbi:hypothetical protein GGI1_19879 [Acidithiobacillus sp. GGI-221]|nr:hypothetical protein GGI1_19879 [Acidithiobacillus sp. GGI-221]
MIGGESTCFILGAGFSRDAGLPLSYDFLEKMEYVRPLYVLGKTLPVLNVPIDELFRFREARKDLFSHDVLNNIEVLLSLVSARNLGNISSRGFTRFQMQIAISQTIAYYVHNANNNSYLHKFVDGLSRSAKSSIITLNYDDLIERACESNSTPYSLGIARRAFGGVFDIDCSMYIGNMLDIDERVSSLPIYKLHGSCNWMACQDKNVTVISDMQEFFVNGDFWDTSGWNKYNLIMEPPTIDKMYAGRILSAIWGKAYDSIRQASRLVVIGYSFPENDGYVKYLFMASVADNHVLKEALFVEPQCDGNYRARIKWLIDLLKAKGVEITFCCQTAEKWVNSYFEV